ncbi:hypothetical protein EIP86_007347 [Pleurotus ostreatoroseus]|nr:hypothetical protein EIP86_007347 [Pleurotus ostreatoroseus]
MTTPAHGNNLRRAQYEKLTAECKALEDELHELNAAVQRKQDSLTAKKAERSPLAPVYTLPDEAWFLILEAAFLHHFPRCHNPRSTLTDSPIAFSHVSRRFRALALALPSIWACVHVNPRQSFVYHNLLQEQLHRSKDRPLSITFICRSPTEESLPMLEYSAFPTSEYSSHFPVCWELLVPHAKRWRHLSFWAEHGSIVQHLLSHPMPGVWDGLSLPQLEHVDVCVGNEFPDDEPMCVHLKPFFQNTPKLSVLRLRGVLLPPCNKSITLNNITKLSLVQMLVESSYDDDSTHVALPRLKHLVLNDVDPLDSCIGFFSFAAPNLSLLEIEAPRFEDGAVFSEYPRSSVVFPKVKRLRLFSFGTDNTIRLFEPTFLEFFPALEHIILHEDCAASFSLGSLRALLRSLEVLHEEGKPSVPLKKLWISFPGNERIEPDIKNVFTQIIKHQSDLGSPLDEACIMVDTFYTASTKQRAGVDSELEEGQQGQEECGEKGPDTNDLLNASPDWDIVDDDWLIFAGDRMWEWQTQLDCPALPYWEPGVEVSWTLDDTEVPLRSSDIV